MTQFTGRAERPGGSEPGSQFLVAHIVASDYPEGGGRQGIARLTVSWGRIPDESGREVPDLQVCACVPDRNR